MEWESNEVTRIELLVGSGGLIISKGFLTLSLQPSKDANQKASQEEGAQQSLTAGSCSPPSKLSDCEK